MNPEVLRASIAGNLPLPRGSKLTGDADGCRIGRMNYTTELIYLEVRKAPIDGGPSDFCGDSLSLTAGVDKPSYLDLRQILTVGQTAFAHKDSRPLVLNRPGRIASQFAMS
jgi:hypothetical protein